MTRVTVVLVHGGSHTSRCWDRLLPLLEAPAMAVDLPGRAGRPPVDGDVTIRDFAAAVVDDIRNIGNPPVVLVGHSLGAAVALCAAAELADRCAAVCLIAGAVPPNGRAVVDSLSLGRRLATKLAARRGPTGAPPARIARLLFCNGMKEEYALAVVAQLVAEPTSVVLLPCSPISLDASTAATYVVTERDRAIPPRIQRRMARRAGITDVRSIRGCHDVMVSMPDRVADIVNAICRDRSSAEGHS